MAKVWRCSYNSDTAAGVRLVNVHHVVSRPGSGATDEGSAAKVRDALHAALTTKYRACLPTSVTVQSLVVREELAEGDTSVPDEAAQTIAAAGTISISGDQLPPPLSVLCTFYTNAAVRSGHGRMFLPNPGNSLYLASTGFWDMTNPPFATLIPAFLNELKADHTYPITAFPDGHLSQVIYSRTRRNRGDADWYFDVTSWTIRTQAHWLRSRMTAP